MSDMRSSYSAAFSSERHSGPGDPPPASRRTKGIPNRGKSYEQHLRDGHGSQEEPAKHITSAADISADGLSQQYVDSYFLRFNRQLDVLRRVDGGASVVRCWHLDHGSGFFQREQGQRCSDADLPGFRSERSHPALRRCVGRITREPCRNCVSARSNWFEPLTAVWIQEGKTHDAHACPGSTF
jgi:hypothetical protein